MTEAQAFITIRSAMLQMLGQLGYSDVRVLAGRQPTKAGRFDNAIYFFAIDEQSQAVQGRSYAPTDSDAGHVERQAVLQTVQLQAFKENDPEDYEAYTASDLCAVAKMILNSLPFTETIRQQGVSVSNITNMREPEFVNEHGDYEKNPSFDFDVGFTREIKPVTPLITDISATVYPLE